MQLESTEVCFTYRDESSRTVIRQHPDVRGIYQPNPNIYHAHIGTAMADSDPGFNRRRTTLVDLPQELLAYILEQLDALEIVKAKAVSAFLMMQCWT